MGDLIWWLSEEKLISCYSLEEVIPVFTSSWIFLRKVRHTDFRPLARNPIKRTYKQLGVNSLMVRTPRVCAISEGINCDGVHEQHHNNLIYSETGTDQVQIPLQSISGDLVLGNKQQDQPIDLSYPCQKTM